MSNNLLSVVEPASRPSLFLVSSSPIVSADNTLSAHDKKMLIRHDNEGNKSYLSVVNNTYRVIENQKVLLPLENQMREYFDPTIYNQITVTETLSRAGARTLVDYQLPKMADNEIVTSTGHKTAFGLRFILKNTFDGSGAIILYSGSIDFFCTNGRISGAFDVTRSRHSSGFSPLVFNTAFDKTIERFSEEVRVYQTYANTKVESAAIVQELFDRLTNHDRTAEKKRERESLSDKLFSQYASEQLQRGSNLFSVMSAITHYASHNDNRFTMRRSGDTEGGRLFDRQEQTAKWFKSDHWNKFVEQHGLKAAA